MQASAVFMTVLLSLSGPLAQGGGQVGGESLTQSGCLVSLLDHVQVPAKRPGVIVSMPYREGAEVQKDDLIAQIDDADAKLRVEVATAELQLTERQEKNKTRVVAAEKSHEASKKQYEINERIAKNTPGAVTDLELDRLRLTMEHAFLSIDLEQYELDNAGVTKEARQAQVSLAQNDVADRRIVAPRGGVISQVFRREGEWVQEGEPIMRILRMDVLKVETFLDSSKFAPHEVLGAPATVTVKLTRDQDKELPNCKVNFVGPEIEPGGAYRIWVEVKNISVKGRDGSQQWLIRPGMMAELKIHLAGADGGVAVNDRPTVVGEE